VDKKIEITGGKLTTENCAYGIVAQYEDVAITGCELALASWTGIYAEGGGDETVTLTDCTGYLGIEDPAEGYMAIAAYGADANVNPAKKIFINNLDPNRYALGTFTESDGQGGMYYGAAVQTTAEPPTSNHVLLGIQATGISLDKDTLTLYLNRADQCAQQLTAIVTPDNATAPEVTWTSGDTGIAAVDENGTVTAVAGGETVITATIGGYSASCTVKVTNLYEVEIAAENGSAEGAGSYEEGMTAALSAKPDDGYHFKGWKISGTEELIAQTGEYTFPVTEDVSLTAVFEKHSADGSGWHTDETSHWNTCECGVKLNETAHTFAWITDKEATAAEAGSKHEECTVCDYAKEPVEIPAAGITADPVGDGGKPGAEPPKDTDDPEGGNPTGGTSAAETGDSSNTTLWTAILLASGAALTVNVYYSRRKKYGR
jgi:hypothetical protein